MAQTKLPGKENFPDRAKRLHALFNLLQSMFEELVRPTKQHLSVLKSMFPKSM